LNRRPKVAVVVGLGPSVDAELLTAGVVLTTATYLHNTGLLSILAILAAIFTALLARTIACGMCALVFILVVSHLIHLLDRESRLA
jgi:hypothetical protein